MRDPISQKIKINAISFKVKAMHSLHSDIKGLWVPSPRTFFPEHAFVWRNEAAVSCVWAAR